MLFFLVGRCTDTGPPDLNGFRREEQRWIEEIMRYQIVCFIPLRMLSIRRLVEFSNRQIVPPKTINIVRKLGTGSRKET